MSSSEELFHKLSFYSWAHPDTEYFIHQHVVDAYTAQIADESTKPIAVFFSLMGLYLYLEHGYTGKEVQNAHIRLSKGDKNWPVIKIPQVKGEVLISDVLATEPGDNRDTKIKEWCESVWSAYSDSHQEVRLYLDKSLNLQP